MKTDRIYLIIILLVLCFSSCREDDPIIPSTGTDVTEGEENARIKGFFLLNEGSMGMNKASLDYFDYTSGEYKKNIYPERNHGVVKELGDIGNDIRIYGGKLYAVINGSGLVEVMNAQTAEHVGTISIPNCRYITFKDGYAYVSSFAGTVQVDPDSQLGYVAKVDTASLLVKDTCAVGYQPQEMVITGNKLYVANSGGYRAPDYDKTVSVIDLATFKRAKTIDVAINLHHMVMDKRGYIYVTSEGDYGAIRPNLYVIDSKNDNVIGHLDIAVTEMCIAGDSLYLYNSVWDETGKNTIGYGLVDTRERKVVAQNFITDGTDASIKSPYGIAVNPDTREILVTDAANYVTPGTVYCFTPEGKKKWSETTGDAPSGIVFTTQKLSDK